MHDSSSMPRPPLRRSAARHPYSHAVVGHRGLIFRWTLRVLGNVADAEEATQEILIRALRALPRFDPRARLSTWLHQIATNYCHSQLREGARRRVLLGEQQGVLAPSAPVGDVEAAMLMRGLLQDADPRCVEAAISVYVDGMSHAEAAAQMRVSRRTIGNLCDRFTLWSRMRLTDGT